MTNRPMTISIDGDTLPLSLGASVDVVECKYKCGGWFVVTTMTKNPPHHFECGIKAMIDCQAQMRAKSGPYYDRWVAALPKARARWLMGMRLWIDSLS